MPFSLPVHVWNSKLLRRAQSLVSRVGELELQLVTEQERLVAQQVRCTTLASSYN